MKKIIKTVYEQPSFKNTKSLRGKYKALPDISKLDWKQVSANKWQAVHSAHLEGRAASRTIIEIEKQQNEYKIYMTTKFAKTPSGEEEAHNPLDAETYRAFHNQRIETTPNSESRRFFPSGGKIFDLDIAKQTAYRLWKQMWMRIMGRERKSLPKQYSKSFWNDLFTNLTGINRGKKKQEGPVNFVTDIIKGVLNVKIPDVSKLYNALVNQGVGGDLALALAEMAKNAVLRDIAMGINRKLNKPDIKMLLTFIRTYKRSLKKAPGGKQFLVHAAKQIMKANEQWGDEWSRDKKNQPPEDLW